LPSPLAGRSAALVVAHPGHELRVHGWLERQRPVVWVLTDGSGHADRGRLASTERLLRQAGARVGAFFGRLSDRSAYSLIMSGDVTALAGLVEELAETLAVEKVDYVAGDAWEGFNPVHDLCRLVIDAAVLVARRGGRPVDDFEFPLEAGPDWQGGGEAISWELDDDALARKLSAARGYPELADEVERALRAHGAEAFRRERLHRVVPLETLVERCNGKPAYERFGEERVAAGHYSSVLRHERHFAPLMAALLERLALG
jgi:hypothetical protein